MSKAHVHSFGFGEETCETCGLSFTASQDNPEVTPSSNGAPMPENIATRQFLRTLLPANYAGKQSTEK